MSSNAQNNEASMPSREEILALLDEKKGMAYVWQTLRQKHGSPKGTYGANVYAAIISRNKPANDGHDNLIDNRTSNPPNSNASGDAGTSTEIVRRPEDEPISLTAGDYCEMQLEVMKLRCDFNSLASLFYAFVSRFHS